MRQITKRFYPGMDLKEEIRKMAIENSVDAAVIVACVGSLKKLRLRVADGKTVKEWSEPFEIVSATGTVSSERMHIHLAAANLNGDVIGGHVKEGCIVNTTIEIVLLIFDEVRYSALFDAATGYDELKVIEKNYESTVVSKSGGRGNGV